MYECLCLCVCLFDARTPGVGGGGRLGRRKSAWGRDTAGTACHVAAGLCGPVGGGTPSYWTLTATGGKWSDGPRGT